MRYLVLPMRPKGTEGWVEARLAGIVTRNCMIGVDVPEVSQTVP
jgi:nitrile hydratase